MAAKPSRPASGAGRKKGAPPSAGARDLARRVREATQLTGSQKRYWLRVLPFLQPVDQERLDAILRGELPESDGAATTGSGDGSGPALLPGEADSSGSPGAGDLPQGP
jgi:hypothetical protein